MGIIKRMRKQTAVYWELASNDSGGVAYDDYGNPIMGTPVEIKCRWEDVIEEIIDSKGTARISSSTVYVDRDMVAGEILMLGSRTDISDPVNIKENDGAYEIMKVGKLPNIKATEFLRTVYL